MLYFKKMKLLKRTGEATINLLTSMTGTAWTRVEHLSEVAPEQENGFMTVVVELDKAFQYDDTYEMPKAIDRYSDQTLLQYCGEVREGRQRPRFGCRKHKWIPKSINPMYKGIMQKLRYQVSTE